MFLYDTDHSPYIQVSQTLYSIHMTTILCKFIRSSVVFFFLHRWRNVEEQDASLGRRVLLLDSSIHKKGEQESNEAYPHTLNGFEGTTLVTQAISIATWPLRPY